MILLVISFEGGSVLKASIKTMKVFIKQTVCIEFLSVFLWLPKFNWFHLLKNFLIYAKLQTAEDSLVKRDHSHG